MKTSAICGKAAVFLVAAAAASCGATVPEPGRTAPADDPAGSAQGQRDGYTGADVRFMQGMITHHAQALAMAALVAERTEREDIRRLARRVELSQESEMALMSRWLERRGEAVPAGDGHEDGHGDGDHGAPGNGRMPGMATAAEMERLADARGAGFDRLFLELMIRHHEGALVMVEDLLATEGAGQEPELFQFAAHVDADQRAEIARMRTLLNALLP